MPATRWAATPPTPSAIDQAALYALRAEWRLVGFMGRTFRRGAILAAGSCGGKAIFTCHVAACPRSRSRRPGARSRAVVGVDLDVVVAQVAGPDRRALGATMQIDSHR